MAVTLNIIEHELMDLGRLVRSSSSNMSFGDFRLYIGSDQCLDPLEGTTENRGFFDNADARNVLYLCGNRSEVQQAHRLGLVVAYVNPDDSKAAENAAFSILEGEPLPVVFNALLDLARAFDQWERAMSTVRMNGGTLQDLLDVSSSFLCNHVVIVDPALKLLAYSKDVACDDPVTIELISHGYHTEENISKFKLHKRFEPWASSGGFVVNDTFEICKYVTVVRSFKTRSSFSLIIVMMCNIQDPDAWLLDIYEAFASQVEFYALRDYPEDKPSGNAADTFLKDLFRGELDDPLVVEERCKLAGIPYEARFCVFYMESEGSVPESRLLSDISRLVAPAKTVLLDGAVAVLCFNCRNGDCAWHCAHESCPLGQRSLSSRLDEMLSRYGIACGRSSMFELLSDGAIAFAQAKEALRYGTKGHDHLKLECGHRWKQITLFDDHAVEFLAESVPKPARKLIDATFAGSIVEAIARSDEQSGTDNCQFLYEYLMHERRTLAVSEALHMHRNNVKYRIDRIESRFGIDTSDPDLRFALLLAFRIKEASAKP